MVGGQEDMIVDVALDLVRQPRRAAGRAQLALDVRHDRSCRHVRARPAAAARAVAGVPLRSAGAAVSAADQLRRVLLDDAILEGHGARVALYSESGVWTYCELLETANRIANVLVRDLGIVPGNRVLLRGPNTPMLAACWLAVMKAGAIAVTTMPMLRAKELVVIAERAQIDHALCDARLARELHQAARATGRLRAS